ncbi:hypothetical protein GH714_015008 [Hevea brasiliensis]|uniref:Leucine-rich repeat-containing N-terminal plant-type domain-containing protein n=1 Tax=Hevea brasiliensis TaxID=3981 RepID=A0A6A6KT46_HEVBR|nr:hypothetical protein GH714_015008 [Hevea brasiliensis]
MMRAWPCFNSSKALSLLVILAVQNWIHGNSSMEKEVTAALGVNISSMVPDILANFSSLESLRLSGCILQGEFPIGIFQLPNLKILNISENQDLKGYLPPFQLRSLLKSLILYETNFVGELPSSIGNLAYLEDLEFYSCNFTGQLPSSLGQIPSQTDAHSKVVKLELSSNKLQGSIPRTLSNLKNLQTLSFHSNNLSGVVDVNIFFQLKKLRTLMLSYNNLWLLTESNTNATIHNFTYLGLASCNLSEFPHFLQNQHELQFLDLSSNNIQGPIPSWLWNMSRNSLQYMNLSHNFLKGFDGGPVFLQWAHLIVLDIQSNMLQGSLLSVPTRSTNYFDGSISPAWRSKCNLRFINLSRNRLQGQLPRSLANCSMLEFIDFGENQLNDSFPSWLGNLPKLKVLILRSNGFYGALRKVGTGKFSKLQIIDLSQNTLTGYLPTTYFRVWNAMKIIDESHMTYMGENFQFPYSSYDNYDYSITMNNKGLELEYLKLPSTLAAIDFSCNRFEGAIPNAIGNLTALHLLNLSNNMLIGHIPSSLANMKELESLDLSSNQLSGQVPLQLSQLTYLSSFNVSWNNLSGPIPEGKQFDTFDRNSYKGTQDCVELFWRRNVEILKLFLQLPPPLQKMKTRDLSLKLIG